MKWVVSGFLASVLGLAACSANAAPAAYDVDPAHSSVVFSVAHLGLSRTTGRFLGLQGKFSYDAANIAASHAELSIDAGSVDTGHAERDQHLKSPDFFDAGQFPRIVFSSTGVSGDANRFSLDGTVTMLGVSRPIHFSVEKIGEGRDPWGGKRAGFIATGKIRRSDFGMNFMPGAVGDEVELSIQIEGLQQQ